MYRLLPHRSMRPHQLLNKMKITSSSPPPSHSRPPNAHDWFNFVTSFTNCIVISSILWGFESYHDKLQMIEDTNNKISDLIVAYRLLERKCTKSYFLPKDAPPSSSYNEPPFIPPP